MEISVSDYIAAGSLFVAIIALIKSFLSDRKVKTLDLQLKEKELERHKADEEDLKKADVEVEERGDRYLFHGITKSVIINS